MLRLGNCLFRNVVDSPTGEKSIWNRENPTDRGHGTVATVGVDVTPAVVIPIVIPYYSK
jgi:hypothetical protein